MRKPHPNVIFQVGLAADKLNPDDIVFKRLWAPGTKDVIVTDKIKSSYLHSLNAGVLMTLLNLPFLFWDLIIKPMGGGFVLMGALIYTRFKAGFKGMAHAVAVDEESLHKAVLASHQKDVAAQGDFLSRLLGDIAAGKTDGEVTAKVLHVEDGKVIEERDLEVTPELSDKLKQIAEKGKLSEKAD
jgi:hypothetical protein